MPECYTHAYIATRALMRSGLTAASQPSFLAGANGPDVLYSFKSWKKQGQPNLPKLAGRMQREATGRFLLDIAGRAITPVQQSYAMGFAAHYSACCTLNPYVTAMSRKGMPYAGREGRRRMEASLDSSLYHKDYKTYHVPLHAGTPVLISEDLAQVSTLLHEALLAVYGEDVPALCLADTFHDNLRMRRFLLSRTGLKKAAVQVCGPFFKDVRFGGSPRARMQPAPPLKKLPAGWKHPYTGEQMNSTLDEMLLAAEQTAAVCIVALMQYWLGEYEEGQLAAVLGDNSYYTGRPEPEQQSRANKDKAV